MLDLQTTIEKLYAEGKAALNDPAARSSFERFRDALTAGTIRAAEKFEGAWQTNAWVKKGILLGFRIGKLAESGDGKVLRFVDKDTYPIRQFTTEDRVRVRIVPEGHPSHGFRGVIGKADPDELAHLVGMAAGE